MYGGFGSYGGYWTSVLRGSIYAFMLTFNWDERYNIAPDSHTERREGMSIRCVAR